MKPLATLLLLLTTLATTPAFAAAKSPLHWTAKPLTAKPGTRATLTVTGQIDPGWHLYALEEPDGGPIATVVGLTDGDPADLINVTEDKPTTLTDPLYNLPTHFFRDTVNFTLHLKLDKSLPPGPTALHVQIRFQSCNDKLCLPPHTDTLEVPLTITR